MRISTVNRSIKKYGYELIKGNGYYYYFPLNESFVELENSMVMTNNLGSDIEFWITELKCKMGIN